MGCGWEVLRGSYGVDFFGAMGFAHQQANFVNSIRLRKKKYNFMLFGVYAGRILFSRIFQF